MPMRTADRISIALMSALMIGAGTMHFVTPQFFVDIVPAALPSPLSIVYVSGVFEILGGLGVLVRRTRRFSALGLIALFVAVFPANVNMAVNHITPTGAAEMPAWAAWARLPLQGLLVWWAWSIARRALPWPSPRPS